MTKFQAGDKVTARDFGWVGSVVDPAPDHKGRIGVDWTGNGRVSRALESAIFPADPATRDKQFTDRLVFVDVETVTLDPQPGSVWEIAVMGPDDDEPKVTQVRPDLSIADMESLKVGRFADRYNASEAKHNYPNDLVSWLISNVPDGAVLVGSNPQFDIAHLDMHWRHYEFSESNPAPWAYHPCDLPSLVAGATGRWPDHDGSLSLKWAAVTVGLDPDAYERHTAAGDVLLARDIWLRVKDTLVRHANTFGSRS